jgi:integrase
MSVHLDKGSWFCKWREDGKERRKYFGPGDIAKHQAHQLDEEQKRQRGKVHVPTGLTISEVCHAYHNQHRVQASTADSDFYRLDRIIVPALGHIQAEALTTQQLNEYVQKRIHAGKQLSTISRELVLLRSALNWAMAQEPPLILKNIVAKYRVHGAKDSEVHSPPTIEEITRIIHHSPPHLRRALCLEWSLGLRPGGEVSRIRWSDVDLTGGKILIRSARKGGPVTRYVPIPDGEHSSMRNQISQWMAEDLEALGVGNGDLGQLAVVHYKLKSVGSMKKSWATAKKKAGITRKMRLYDLRHAMATYALEGGADLKAVSEILGHSRADTTLRFYQHVLKHQHRQAVNKIPAIPSHLFLTTSNGEKRKN